MINVHETGIWRLLQKPLYFPGRDEEFLKAVLENADCTTEVLVHFLENAPLSTDYPDASSEKQSWPYIRDYTALAVLECIQRKGGDLEVTIRTALHKNMRELLSINWIDLPEFLDDAFKNLSAETRLNLVKKVLEWRRYEMNYWAIKECFNDCAFGLLYGDVGGEDNNALARVLQISLRNEEINRSGASEDTNNYEHQEKVIDTMLRLCR